jgi:hypothetical protein
VDSSFGDAKNNFQNRLRRAMGGPASSLTRVPEIENDTPEDAIRKLQVQIFMLSDALAATMREVERLSRG